MVVDTLSLVLRGTPLKQGDIEFYGSFKVSLKPYNLRRTKCMVLDT
jgi:hypothetical protein